MSPVGALNPIPSGHPMGVTTTVGVGVFNHPSTWDPPGGFPLEIPQELNGHFRNRLIGGTGSMYKAYFLGLSFREYRHKIWPEIWY